MDSYDRGMIRFHWASAAGLLVLWPLGKLMTRGSGPPSSALYTVHVVLGVTIAALTIARIVWMIRHERPEELDMPRWERVLFAVNHVALYAVLLALSISGIGILLAAGSLDATALAKSDGDVRDACGWRCVLPDQEGQHDAQDGRPHRRLGTLSTLFVDIEACLEQQTEERWRGLPKLDWPEGILMALKEVQHG